jgi:hypothetical protein
MKLKMETITPRARNPASILGEAFKNTLPENVFHTDSVQAEYLELHRDKKLMIRCYYATTWCTETVTLKNCSFQ